MTLAQRFVSSHYLSSPIITSSICEHPASRETEQNETQADGGIDLSLVHNITQDHALRRRNAELREIVNIKTRT